MTHLFFDPAARQLLLWYKSIALLRLGSKCQQCGKSTYPIQMRRPAKFLCSYGKKSLSR